MDVKFKHGNRNSLPKTNVVEGAYYQTLDTGQLFLGTSTTTTLEVGNIVQDIYGERGSLVSRQGANNFSIGPSSLILNSTDSTANGFRTIIAGSENCIIPRTSQNVSILSSDGITIDIPPVIEVEHYSDLPADPSGPPTVYYVMDEAKYYYYSNGWYENPAYTDYSFKLGQSSVIASLNSSISATNYSAGGAGEDHWAGSNSLIAAVIGSRMHGINSAMVSGNNNEIHTDSVTSAIFGSTNSTIGVANSQNIYSNEVIIGGSGNIIRNSNQSTIIGGRNSSINNSGGGSTIIGADTGMINWQSGSVVVGGYGIRANDSNAVFFPHKIVLSSGGDTELTSNQKYTSISMSEGDNYSLTLPSKSGVIATLADIPTVSASQILTSGTPIGTVTVGGTQTTFYAPGGSGGSTVTYAPSVTSGTTLGTLSIDSVDYNITAPTIPTVSASQTLTSGQAIGSVTVDTTTTTFYAPIPDEVSLTQTVTSGTKIAELNVGETSTDIYIPDPQVLTAGRNITIDANDAINAFSTNVTEDTTNNSLVISEAFRATSQSNIGGTGFIEVYSSTSNRNVAMYRNAGSQSSEVALLCDNTINISSSCSNIDSKITLKTYTNNTKNSVIEINAALANGATGNSEVRVLGQNFTFNGNNVTTDDKLLDYVYRGGGLDETQPNGLMRGDLYLDHPENATSHSTAGILRVGYWKDIASSGVASGQDYLKMSYNKIERCTMNANGTANEVCSEYIDFASGSLRLNSGHRIDIKTYSNNGSTIYLTADNNKTTGTINMWAGTLIYNNNNVTHVLDPKAPNNGKTLSVASGLPVWEDEISAQDIDDMFNGTYVAS